MSWQRGERIPRPSDFRVTDIRLTGRYTFAIDDEHGYLRQAPVQRDDPSPTTYYRLIRPGSLPQIMRPRWFKPLRFGLVTVVFAGIGLMIYPLYPGVRYQMAHQITTTIGHTDALAATPPTVSDTNRVIIPKLGVDTAILEGTSLGVLDHADGVWHQTGTLQSGNFVLAGHRFKYLPPNTSTLYNLGQLTTGDAIIVDWYHVRYVYVVDRLETVPATDTGVLTQSGGPRLTIYTCTNSAQTKRTVALAHRQP